MKKLILSVALLSLFGHKIIIPVKATLFDNILELIPEPLFPLIFSVGPEEAFGNPCDQVSLNAAQYNFNTMVGVDPTLTWRNSSALNAMVRQIFSNGSNSAFQVMCR